jgi:uncharacterized protein (UPF0332 family)
MTRDEQELFKTKHYNEAIRYMENAKETLQKAKKEDGYYHDKKYVRTACATAYSGVLVALDAYLILKDVEMPKKKRRSITFYSYKLSQLDGKMSTYLDVVYSVLHLDGYYDGALKASIIRDGFEVAYQIIEKIKPAEA